MIHIIAALTKDYVIGKDNKIPWKIPEDLRLFRETTKGHSVVMGRKTYESIGRPLPNRKNIVVSSTLREVNDVQIVNSLEDALKDSLHEDLFIIGGQKIYEEALPYAHLLHLSWIEKSYEGDTFFPKFDEDDWMVQNSSLHKEFTYVVYERISKPKLVK
jgi:dihydrofolate reductase